MQNKSHPTAACLTDHSILARRDDVGHPHWQVAVGVPLVEALAAPGTGVPGAAGDPGTHGVAHHAACEQAWGSSCSVTDSLEQHGSCRSQLALAAMCLPLVGGLSGENTATANISTSSQKEQPTGHSLGSSRLFLVRSSTCCVHSSVAASGGLTSCVGSGTVASKCSLTVCLQ